MMEPQLLSTLLPTGRKPQIKRSFRFNFSLNVLCGKLFRMLVVRFPLFSDGFFKHHGTEVPLILRTRH